LSGLFETKFNPIQGSVNIGGALLSIGREVVNWLQVGRFSNHG
jgi:hypothetical protein